MKGTFFSSDFIKDTEGNFKYLEVNTDTSCEPDALQFFDWSSFKQILVNNNIDRLEVIYKLFASRIIDNLESFIQNDNDISNIEFLKHEEDINSIYPVEIDDNETTFVLRFAYSEAAILDSEYAKNNLNFFDLFRANNDDNVYPELFHSSSEYTFDSLTTGSITQEKNIPDFISKEILSSPGDSGIRFYNVGRSDLSLTDRLTQFRENVADTETLIQRFYNTIDNDKVRSYRSFDIVYGSNLDVVNIASFTAQSPYQIPSEGDITFDDSLISNILDKKYFLDYTTKAPHRVRGYKHGLFEEETVIKSDGTEVLVKDLQVGDELKSYHIEGSPDTDDTSELLGWSLSGSEFPSGSYETTTTVISMQTSPLGNQFIINIELEDGNSFRLAPSTLLLVYDSSEDKIIYKQATDIDPSTHKLMKQDDTLLNISDVKYEILDGEYNTIGLDVEDEDTYFLSLGGETPVSLKLVIHNNLTPECFIAGTEIILGNGDVKNIEDVVEGDIVKTFNESTGEIEDNKVYEVVSPIHDDLIKYTLSDGTELTSTFDHPFYVNGLSLASYYPEKTNRLYDMDTEVGRIKEGDVLNEFNNTHPTIEKIEVLPAKDTQTYLLRVENNENFYANGILVHNKKCFTAGQQVLMSDGTTKPIEDIEIGDEVSTMHGKSNVEDTYKYSVNREIEIYTNDQITVRNPHPLFIDGEWKTPKEAGWESKHMYVENLYNLKTDSNFIVEGVPADGTANDEFEVEKDSTTGYSTIKNK
jgi:hypothetical protein